MFIVAHARVELTLIKLVVDSRYDPVLRTHLVGEAAVEIIKCLALAPGLGTTKKHLDEADCLILHIMSGRLTMIKLLPPATNRNESNH